MVRITQPTQARTDRQLKRKDQKVTKPPARARLGRTGHPPSLFMLKPMAITPKASETDGDRGKGWGVHLFHSIS